MKGASTCWNLIVVQTSFEQQNIILFSQFRRNFNSEYKMLILQEEHIILSTPEIAEISNEHLNYL